MTIANLRRDNSVQTNMDQNSDITMDMLTPPEPMVELYSGSEDEEADPFSHRLEISRWKWIRSILLTPILFPLRFFLILLTLLFAAVVSQIGTFGLTDDEDSKPLTGFRLKLRTVANYCGRVAVAFGGFKVTVKGQQAPYSQAPILTVAPHSSFFDAVAVFYADNPYVVARAENKNTPILGKCFRIAQAIWVSREDPLSRQKTIQEIIRRSNSSDDWPALMLFPEGSTSNRRALMTFKQGAFIPGKPVQPVVLRYPNKTDTVTWTWNQKHGSKTVLWATLVQPYTNVEIEFLPPYVPNEAERQDPKLYARNVRDVMAKALGVPATDATFEEAKARFGKKKTLRSRLAKKTN